MKKGTPHIDPAVGRILRAKCRSCKHPVLNHLPPNAEPGKPTDDDAPAHCNRCKCIVRWRYVVNAVRGS